eukprot:365061-Chlamydomonas_euryale.AAC.3
MRDQRQAHLQLPLFPSRAAVAQLVTCMNNGWQHRQLQRMQLEAFQLRRTLFSYVRVKCVGGPDSVV